MSLNQNNIETAALGIDRTKAEVTSLTTKYEAMANAIARITRVMGRPGWLSFVPILNEKALKDHDPEFSDLLKKKSPSSSTLKAAIARLISIWQEDRSSVRTSQEEANADLRQISDEAYVALQATKEVVKRLNETSTSIVDCLRHGHCQCCLAGRAAVEIDVDRCPDDLARAAAVARSAGGEPEEA